MPVSKIEDKVCVWFGEGFDHFLFLSLFFARYVMLKIPIAVETASFSSSFNMRFSRNSNKISRAFL